VHITVTGNNYLQEIDRYDVLEYNDIEHELTIRIGNSTLTFRSVRVKNIAWNSVCLSALSPMGSGNGGLPELRTIVIKLA
jgi:hypothetical protein